MSRRATMALGSLLERIVETGLPGVVAMPALIRGELVYPALPPPDVLAGAGALGGAGARDSLTWNDVQIFRQPVYDRSSFAPTGEHQYILLPRPAPEALIETDPSDLARGLFALPFHDVLDYIDQLKAVLLAGQGTLREVAARVNATLLLDDRMVNLVYHQLPYLLDSEGLGQAVDRELGTTRAAGRDYLDGWIDVDARSYPGVMSRMGERVFEDVPGLRGGFRPHVRAFPTRQLHITAGNAPIIPFLSLLRAIATKGAAAIKSPAEATAISAILAAGMKTVDPTHPITRHTSLVYWPGGDREFEDVVFAPGAFERVVVWGSAETVESVRHRVSHAKAVFLNPRYSVSLIGRDAFPNHCQEVAARASIDSMIGNQQECISSLVHYVEGDESTALAYCHALRQAMELWDREFPHTLPHPTLGKLRMLRRGELLQGTWFENGKPPYLTSAVVYMPEAFDVSAHPMCRLVVVRRVQDLAEVVPLLNSAVSAVGVYPDRAVPSLRDAIAARGVSSIFPLGQCERTYGGMPHDGMRVLSELVNWTNSGQWVSDLRP